MLKLLYIYFSKRDLVIDTSLEFLDNTGNIAYFQENMMEWSWLRYRRNEDFYFKKYMVVDLRNFSLGLKFNLFF